MTVVASWGSPIPLAAKRTVPLESEVKTGACYEFEHTLSESPRPLTDREASAALMYFVRRWAAEHPSYEIKYAAFERSSPPKIRMQFVAHHTPIPLAVIAAWAVAAVIIAVAVTVIVATVSVVGTVASEIISFVKDPVGYASHNPLGTVLIVGGAVVVGYGVYRLVRGVVKR